MQTLQPELSVNSLSTHSFAVAALALTIAVTSTAFDQEPSDVTSDVTSEVASEVDSKAKPESTARLKTANAGSSIQLKTTSVTGSRELPKVLVIVPWKSSGAMGPGERPLASLVEEALTPVDPDVFRRQLSYYTKLKEASAKSSSGEKAN